MVIWKAFLAFTAAILGLVCVGLLIAWARSYCVHDYFELTQDSVPSRFDAHLQKSEKCNYQVEWTRGEVQFYRDYLSFQCQSQVPLQRHLQWQRYPPGDPDWVLSDFVEDKKIAVGRVMYETISRRGTEFEFAPRDDPEYYERTFLVRAPIWLLAVIAGLPCADHLLRVSKRYRRLRWRTPGAFCGVCGYDLRATPDRCPECGTETRGINRRRPKPVAVARSRPFEGLNQDHVVAVAFVALVGTLAVWVLCRDLLH